MISARDLSDMPDIPSFAEYCEVDVQLTDVAAIYRHEPLTEQLVRRLNADVSLSDLEADVNEIGYPERG